MNTILLIDDDATETLLNKKTLEKQLENINIIDCSSAPLAINLLESAKDFPNYILLDINMPQMDGWGFLDIYIEKGWDTKETKILMLTSSSADEDIVKIEKYKPLVNSYILKPLDKFEINEKLIF